MLVSNNQSIRYTLYCVMYYYIHSTSNCILYWLKRCPKARSPTLQIYSIFPAEICNAAAFVLFDVNMLLLFASEPFLTH